MKMNLQSREDLQALREQALEAAKKVANPSWQRVYWDLAQAADVLDAFIARTEVREGD